MNSKLFQFLVKVEIRTTVHISKTVEGCFSKTFWEVNEKKTWKVLKTFVTLNNNRTRILSPFLRSTWKGGVRNVGNNSNSADNSRRRILITFLRSGWEEKWRMLKCCNYVNNTRKRILTPFLRSTWAGGVVNVKNICKLVNNDQRRILTQFLKSTVGEKKKKSKMLKTIVTW